MVNQTFSLEFDMQYRSYERYDDGAPTFVRFQLHPDSTHNKKLFQSRDGEVLYQTQVPITALGFQTDQPPLSYATTYPLIDELLSELHIDPVYRDWFIGEIISEAAKIVNTHLDPMFWVMTVNIQITTNIYLEDSELIDDGSNGMVPASRSSMAALERVLLKDCRESCTVCLEELPTLVTRMPCCHVFHERCIIEWLKNSHYCPVCRFELPT